MTASLIRSSSAISSNSEEAKCRSPKLNCAPEDKRSCPRTYTQWLSSSRHSLGRKRIIWWLQNSKISLVVWAKLLAQTKTYSQKISHLKTSLPDIVRSVFPHANCRVVYNDIFALFSQINCYKERPSKVKTKLNSTRCKRYMVVKPAHRWLTMTPNVNMSVQSNSNVFI